MYFDVEIFRKELLKNNMRDMCKTLSILDYDVVNKNYNSHIHHCIFLLHRLKLTPSHSYICELFQYCYNYCTQKLKFLGTSVKRPHSNINLPSQKLQLAYTHINSYIQNDSIITVLGYFQDRWKIRYNSICHNAIIKDFNYQQL